MAVTASPVGAPTVTSPVVDMMEVADRNRDRVMDDEGLGDHAAHGDADDVGPLETQFVQHPECVLGHVLDQVGRRAPVAAEEGHEVRHALELGGESANRGCRSGW